MTIYKGTIFIRLYKQTLLKDTGGILITETIFSLLRLDIQTLCRILRAWKKSKEKITTNLIVRREISTKGEKNRGHRDILNTHDIY